MKKDKLGINNKRIKTLYVGIFRSRDLQPEQEYETMITGWKHEDGSGVGKVHNAKDWKLIKTLSVNFKIELEESGSEKFRVKSVEFKPLEKIKEEDKEQMKAYEMIGVDGPRALKKYKEDAKKGVLGTADYGQLKALEEKK